MQSNYLTTLTAFTLGLVATPTLQLAAQEAASTPPGDAANSRATYAAYYADVEAQQAEHARRLAEIDRQHSESLRAYREDNVRRAQALSDRHLAAQKQLAEQGLRGDAYKIEFDRLQAEDRKRRQDYAAWRDSTAQSIQADYLKSREAQFASHRLQMERLLERRNSTLERLMTRPAQLGALALPGDGSAPAGDETDPAAKSGATAQELYRQHCALCHGGRPGLRESRYDLYEAVVVDDAGYFLNRVRNGPGQMPGIDAIQALTDAQVFSIRDWIREQGDINTGVVARDEPDKTPDAGPAPSGPVVATSVPPGLPPVTPGSPLPGARPGSSEAVQDAVARTRGVADLTCNVLNDVEVSWIAPFSWDAGWIPPGATMDETGVPWEDSWMLRLRARLEDPTGTNSAGHPAPGWCTWTNGSLGDVAGKAREIVIFAHTQHRPFAQFDFSGGNVTVWQADGPTIGWPHSTDYILAVMRAVHGIYLRSGNRQGSTNGEVHAHVRRIDVRWSVSGVPAFLVTSD